MKPEDASKLAARIEEFEVSLCTPESTGWLTKEARETIAHALRTFAVPEVDARVLFSDDAHCPGCGHNRDKSSVSTILLLDGRRECQKCGALWKEIERPDGSVPSPLAANFKETK